MNVFSAEKSTRPAVLWATSYMSQLIDQPITPRKLDWFEFMWSVPQLALEVTQLYEFLMVLVLMNGGLDELGPEGTPNATLLAGSPVKKGPPAVWKPSISIFTEATRLSVESTGNVCPLYGATLGVETLLLL